MIFEGDLEFVCKSVDYCGADTKSGEGTGAGHKSDFGNITPVFVVFFELVVNEV